MTTSYVNAHALGLDFAKRLFDALSGDCVVTDSGCWVKRGPARKCPYVNVHARPFSIHAHRLAFFVTHGYLPKVVMHACDNTACFNPNHLAGGTQADNLADMTAKGRRMFAGGRRWMWKDDALKRVPLASVDEFIADGWKIGKRKVA